MQKPDLDIPPTNDPIAQRAYDLQKEVNEAISEKCQRNSALAWTHLAETTAEAMIDTNKWSYLMLTAFGVPPMIRITGYKGPLP
jgi:copper oxidase (laccase) domain-containing protein